MRILYRGPTFVSRLSRRRPGIFIVISIVLAFVAATLDLFRILFEMRSSEDPRVSALFIAREVCIALGQSSRFLFFWDYAARSPISSPKTRRGLAEMALEGGIIAGAVAVAVLQTVWRLAPTGVQQGPVYFADMILQLVLAAVVALKIVRFFFVRGTPPSYIRRGVSIVGGIAIQMGITITSLFVCASMRASLTAANTCECRRLRRLYARPFSAGN